MAEAYLVVEIPAGGDGYVWRPGWWRDEGGVERQGPALFKRDVIFDYYRPADLPIAVYRELAATEPTQEGVLKFANRYGILGLRPVAGLVEVQNAPGEDDSVIRWHPGEPLEHWLGVIEELHEAVGLWDAARAGDQQRLSEALEQRKGRVCYRGTARYRAWLRRDDARYADGKARQVDREAIENVIGALLQGSHADEGDLVAPAVRRVLMVVNQNVTGLNGPSLFWDEHRGKAVAINVSASLLGYLWLQFLQAVEAGKDPRRCDQCGRWFEVHGGAMRTDRITCSDACRARAYRERKERAARMRREGKTVKQIAKELGSDEATVSGWLNESKRKEK